MIVLILAIAALADDLTYGKAWRNSKRTGRDLIVLVTAEKCIPCEALKSDLKRLDLTRANLVELDIKDPQIANLARIDDSGNIRVPQLIRFKRTGTKWHRSDLGRKRDPYSLSVFLGVDPVSDTRIESGTIVAQGADLDVAWTQPAT